MIERFYECTSRFEPRHTPILDFSDFFDALHFAREQFLLLCGVFLGRNYFVEICRKQFIQLHANIGYLTFEILQNRSTTRFCFLLVLAQLAQNFFRVLARQRNFLKKTFHLFG
ncbi:hypothetical protein A3J43_02805 [Candidatus Uhrbacteria bacterium RIFCSPHIGHO2_12_FULL_54_23]|uniref:Uncharacterized protein n=2 Tax=Candidatus Uhriibacteriota TaxID=1752732 RepID=A0A1F7UGY3_9BACT|nr:MAG: hypothetical protein A3J43_02805 [Candidatus Uhrbacteria bacterium RIFCSPHIGHO2_12_FULL_54_23]OGL91204.1 MAG: hypothetical protein A3J36_01650 [Candidatus Uhrbacteria bacterium RIFCSPLOWO2_02_FULL_54_37]